VIVVVVTKLVMLNVETSLSNGFKNSEQNTVALNVIFSGLTLLLEREDSFELHSGTESLTDFTNCWLQLSTQTYSNLQMVR
jgi:hypothetical protein